MTNMSPLVYAEYVFRDMTARYTTDAAERVDLCLYPTALGSRIAARRTTVANESWGRAFGSAPQRLANLFHSIQAPSS
jgi:hypothetical protein